MRTRPAARGPGTINNAAASSDKEEDDDDALALDKEAPQTVRANGASQTWPCRVFLPPDALRARRCSASSSRRTLDAEIEERNEGHSGGNRDRNARRGRRREEGTRASDRHRRRVFVVVNDERESM